LRQDEKRNKKIKKKGAKTYFPILKPATHQYLDNSIPFSLDMED